MSRRVTLAVVVVAITFGIALPLVASQARQMPVTTSSDEARQIYMQALDKAENLELEEAGKLAEQAIAKDPEFAMAYLLRSQTGGGFRVSRENLDKAVNLAQKVSPGERHMIHAAKAQSDGDMVALKNELNQLEQLFPEDKHVQLRLARYYRGLMQDAKRAVVHYQKATALDPSYAAAYNELGYAQASLNQNRAAERSFQKYIALRPDSPNPYDSYAEFLMKIGRYDESIAQYRKALAKDPAFLSAFTGIGNNQVFKKDFVAARRTFEEQRTKAPDLDAQLVAMENIAMSYVHERKPQEAVRVYEEMASRAQSGQLGPRAVNAHLDAAFVLSQLGQADAADEHVVKASEVLSSASLPAPVQERLGRQITLERARVLAAQEQPDQALAEINKVQSTIEQRQIPGEVRALNEVRGSVAMKQQRYKEALAYFDKADSESPFVMFQRAMAAEHLGQRKLAASLKDKVARWNVNDLGYAVVRPASERSSDVVATSGRRRK